MDILGLDHKKRTAVRLRQILAILGSNGFGFLLARMRLGHHLPITQQLSPSQLSDSSPQSLASKSREVLGQLGPTFMKFGQIVSTRPDLVGEPFASEFSKLQDDAPALPYSVVKETIETELGKPLASIFKSFDKTPIASASIGQVHRAVLKNNTSVVVKVQRPGIQAQVADDISIMRFLSAQMTAHVAETRAFHPGILIDEFEHAISREMDYRQEARQAQQFRAFFKDDETVYIPAVFMPLTTPRVLVMEYVEGAKLSQVLSSKDKKYSKKLIAHRLADALFRQVMLNGLFHADPHPGNILILPHNRVCFIDLGMVGRIEPAMLEDLMRCFMLIIDYDIDGVVRQLDDMNLLDEGVDRPALRDELMNLMGAYYGAELSDMHLSEIMVQFFDVLRRHHLHVPRETILLGRSMVITEGVARRLDPHFNAVEAYKPYAKELMARQFKPARIKNLLNEYAYEISRFVRTFPSDFKRIASVLQGGKLKVEFEHRNLDLLTRDLERIGNKLSVAMVLAALIVGSSMIIVTDKGPMLLGMPALGVVGFALSGALGLGLIYSIIRS